ncbi:MFS transporter [Vibrio gangliei]|uniref:MFS transporter n=1 Tax=Vibrio gangliei TaxID=2077090 RepID=UPI000D01649E|nr:MFS transporter [Vibrio gangliei]
MWLFGSLFTLGINQTLLIALLPQIAVLFNVDAQSHQLGLIAMAINVNLISYWIGSGLWGKYLSRMSLTQAYWIAGIGYITCHLLFVAALFHLSSPQLWLAALSRFGLGLFSSAFMPIGQTYLTHKHPAELNNISKLSGAATLGRLVGPTFVFLPLGLSTILLLTLLPISVSLLLIKWLVRHPLSLNVIPTEAKAVSALTLVQRYKLTFLTAGLTTMLVAIYQLMLVPYLSQLGFNSEQTSNYLAGIMLAISSLMGINQLWITPKLLAKPVLIWHFISWPLAFCGYILAAFEHSLITLILFSTALTVALSNLPAWYSKQLLSLNQNHLHTSQLSGLLAQSHSSGHLMGTALASLAVYLSINAEFLLIMFISILFLSAVLLKRQHLTQISTAN